MKLFKIQMFQDMIYFLSFSLANQSDWKWWMVASEVAVQQSDVGVICCAWWQLKLINDESITQKILNDYIWS